MSLPAEVFSHMRAHAAWAAPEEACGLVATTVDGHVTFFYACTNVEASTEAFTVDPAEHFRALSHAESRGWRIGGSFHSHPVGPLWPSAADLDAALDPEWVYFIGSSKAVRAYRIVDGESRELTVITKSRH